MIKTIAVLIALAIAAAGVYVFFKTQGPKQDMEQNTQTKTDVLMELSLRSPAFEHMGNIPVRYTCDGEKLSPPLEISGVGSEARSLVLIMEDPDVPRSARADGMWDHWLKFNLSPSLTRMEEGRDPGGVSGVNTSGNLGYVPPCPPDREHRYFFKLYSLDTELSLGQGATKAEIARAMEGHILQETTLIGLYDRR